MVQLKACWLVDYICWDCTQLDNILSASAGPSEAETPEIVTAQQPEILFHPTKRCRLNDGADATVYSPPSSPKGIILKLCSSLAFDCS